MRSTVTRSLDRLKDTLSNGQSDPLEQLSNDLLGCVVGVRFSRARGGDQQGGDGGVHGDGNRNLIYESRCYGENSRLSEREIRGEIDQAVERDPLLEAWTLVTTQEVSEQTVRQMQAAAGPRGISTVVVDWQATGIPRLAALCAEYPDLVQAVYGAGVRNDLDKIRSSPQCAEVLDSIKSELRSSTIGYEALRHASHRRVRDIWVSRSRAEARFNQNVAGGANDASQIVREQPMADLNTWFEAVATEHPGLVLGREGMGKTWAALDWLQSNLIRLPIVVLVPSSSVMGPLTTPFDVVALIARALRDLGHNIHRDLEYWENRVQRLLRRPAKDGPALLIFFDGLNERPSFEWITIFNQLQDEPFYRHTVVLASVRESFLAERLGGLKP